MLWRVNGQSQLDRGLLNSITGKIADGTLAKTDLLDCLRLFCMLCNHDDEIRFEIKDYSQSYQLEIGSQHFAVVFLRGACEARLGDMESPDITMKVDLANLLSLLMGSLNSGAAHMNGDIQYKGTKNGAIKLQSIFELFLDKLGI
ncbi:MAG: SCP2 sterol-binding domain-containing protein [Spirochaetes bacterium]|nr:SCP2 sterol-binding domain-containing protein [Spirochaetota bacterium]